MEGVGEDVFLLKMRPAGPWRRRGSAAKFGVGWGRLGEGQAGLEPVDWTAGRGRAERAAVVVEVVVEAVADTHAGKALKRRRWGWAAASSSS